MSWSLGKKNPQLRSVILIIADGFELQRGELGMTFYVPHSLPLGGSMFKKCKKRFFFM